MLEREKEEIQDFSLRSKLELLQSMLSMPRFTASGCSLLASRFSLLAYYFVHRLTLILFPRLQQHRRELRNINGIGMNLGFEAETGKSAIRGIVFAGHFRYPFARIKMHNRISGVYLEQ